MEKEIADKLAISRALTRITYEIFERNQGFQNLALVGIKTRGIYLAQRIAAKMEKIESTEVRVYALDPLPYRDDQLGLPNGKQVPNMNLKIADKRVILVDDVLYTGRTVRAAMDAVMRAGRAKQISLAVLVDRGHRELPIRADYVGKNIPTSQDEQILVKLHDVDEVEQICIKKRG